MHGRKVAISYTHAYLGLCPPKICVWQGKIVPKKWTLICLAMDKNEHKNITAVVLAQKRPVKHLSL